MHDPRDAIISYYYSMGYGHKPPTSNGHVERFMQQREKLIITNINEYALGEGKDFFCI